MKHDENKLMCTVYRFHNVFIIYLWNPCKKCDEDSHGNSMPFHVTTRLGGGLFQIHTKFHDDSMSFIQVLFSMLEHDMDFGKVQVMTFPFGIAKKMMGFPVRIWSHFRTRPNCRGKDVRKSLSHFLQGRQKM